MANNTPHIRVTIEVEGPAEEVAAWLSKLPGGTNSVSLSGAGSTFEWTDELADRLVGRLSDRARHALAFISDASVDGETITFEGLQDELGVNGVQLGGIFASFGFAERAGLPKPFETDYGRRVYSMDPEVARVMVEALNRYND